MSGLVVDAAWFEERCKPGQGPETCSYILGTPDGVKCAKDIPGGRELIDSRRDTMGAKGDNCLGYQAEHFINN